jgi:hypothetical protein
MNRTMNFNNKKKSKPSSILIWIAVVLFILLGNSESDDGAIALAVLLFVAVAIYVLIKLMNKIKLRPKEDKVCSGKDVGVSHQHQQKSYSVQEVQDRDEQRRREQLESFLKNGIIDRKEYLVLKARYEEKQ